MSVRDFQNGIRLELGHRARHSGAAVKESRSPRESAPAVSPSRLAAASILHRVLRDDSYASPLLGRRSRSTTFRPKTDGSCRSSCSECFAGAASSTTSSTRRTSRPAEKLDSAVRVALWLGLYQLRHLERVPEHAAVNESVELVKNSRAWRGASLVNAALARRNARANRPRRTTA